MVGLNLFQGFPLFSLGMVQIASQLKIHPKVLRGTKEPGQPQSRAWSDTPPTVDDLVDSLIWHVNGLGQVALGQPHRLQKLFQKHLARMGWRPVARDTDHNSHSPPAIRSVTMIIDNFNFVCSVLSPHKTDPKSIVDPDAMLAPSIPLQRFQSIAWRNLQVGKGGCRIKLIQFPNSHPP
jgi:hypothetical protein